MKYKLIIFDLDGVLVDACEWHRTALNASLLEVCNYQISREDHYRSFNGLPTRVKLQKLSQEGIVPTDKHEVIYNLKQKKTIETIIQEAQIRNEKIELLSYLKEDGCIVTCFTNSIKKTAFLMLKKTGVFNFFDMIVTNQDVKNPKPSPEGYEKIIKHFKVDVSETLIIEDSPKGLAAARKSGAIVLHVKSPDQVNLSMFKEIL
tara:strand:- start:34282 stop:34893 length:612 start_codon:yes stop_codon:yes gene_type:complete